MVFGWSKKKKEPKERAGEFEKKAKVLNRKIDEFTTLLWSYETGANLNWVSVSSDGSYVAAGSHDNKVYFFNREGELLWSYKTGSFVNSVSVSSDGKYVAAGSWDHKVYFFNREGRLLWSYKTGNIVYSVSVSSDGSYIAVGAGLDDHKVYFFNREGELLWSYETGGIVESVSVSSDGSYIAVGAVSAVLNDHKVYFFNREGELLWSYETGNIVHSVSVSSDGKYVAAGSEDNTVYFFNREGRLLWSYETGSIVWDVSVSSDGSYVAAGSGKVYFFNREGELLWSYKTGSFVNSVSVSSDGSYVAVSTGSNDHKVYFFRFDVAKYRSEEYYEAPEEAPQVSQILPSGFASSPTLEAFSPDLLKRYEPLEFLGEGGFAKVFKVRRKSDGKIVAVKIPRIDEKTSSLFLKEVAAWYNLNHPNIVRLYKADILPIPHLEMEYVEGTEVNGKHVTDLEGYPKPVDEGTALRLIRGIAEGLKHAHGKGVYHFDLKPLNVLLKADLTPKITDWGLAKISARSSLSTHTGYSPLYAAPEQLDENAYGKPDHRTDIYGLGVIFYELLTGKLPYEGYSPGAVVGKILARDVRPNPPSKFDPALSKYDGILERLLAKRKEDRYGGIEEFLKDLDSIEELDREREELKKSLGKTREKLKSSRSREEIRRLMREAVEKTARIALLSAKLNDRAELLNALDDLKFYTRENLDDLLNATEQVELILKEGIPVSEEFVERLKVLLHRIQKEV